MAQARKIVHRNVTCAFMLSHVPRHADILGNEEEEEEVEIDLVPLLLTRSSETCPITRISIPFDSHVDSPTARRRDCWAGREKQRLLESGKKESAYKSGDLRREILNMTGNVRCPT